MKLFIPVKRIFSNLESVCSNDNSNLVLKYFSGGQKSSGKVFSGLETFRLERDSTQVPGRKSPDLDRRVFDDHVSDGTVDFLQFLRSLIILS